ncbi:hypothetical protein CHRY9390_01255 [Chryseobacterium aquaeductus]|uniref:WG repeat protein n=1 Tax=Chryseobacterium aquaeductus TaxID=2675056 RepID=A0A9N8QS25_9FLAO|nr:hypothetical protein [Chryseobacterium aquaeductus]CAA7330584.1 hypothetical protein CHRY9390_01255 [Chryseobacterium potabilaquae]CAD7804657.1 hypothetical protein CHRY9390_01255 [Chryseobacterium aquaeductus]
MKKFYLLLFGLTQTFAYSQTQNLASLATGENIGMNALFDTKDNLYGYVSMYSLGKTDKKSQKFEYVILDKNLNPVANKEFEAGLLVSNYFGYVDFKGQIILRPSDFNYLQAFSKDAALPVSMVIDPKTNTVKPKVYYDYLENGTFVEINQPKSFKEERKENRAEKKDKGYNYVSSVGEIKEGGFIAVEYNDYGRYVNKNSLIKFDDNKKEIWRYNYNTNGDKKVFSDLTILDKDEKSLYGILRKVNDDDKSFSLLVIDMKTGKEISNKPLNGLSAETIDYIDELYSNGRRMSNDKTFDDRIVLLGRNYISKKVTGFSRLMLDKTSYNVDLRELNYKPDLVNHIPKLSADGGVENGYYLQTKDVYFLSDGSVGILSEKFKPEGNYSAPKTTDLVYINTDKDFKVKDVQVFEKEKTRWANNDYLFSQYLNNGKDVVFFFRDYQKDQVTKEKKWNLFINTVINGKFNQEVIPISEKDNYVVTPYVAKEGYILLRELNEKEKFNQVRLERLNY